jgi:predicted phage terminase large subunit-like protein
VKSKERPSQGKGTRRQSPVLRLGDEAIPPELRHLRNHPAFELAYRFPKEGLKHFERLRCEQSLLAFFERAWREIDPAPLKVNWHHAAICAHLEAVSRGEIRRIVVNVPPRTTKTIIVNVCWPAWCWTQPKIGPLSGPQTKFMCISYGQRLSTEIATLARRLILSDWYQGHWGERVKILDDQGRIDNFGTTAGGFRIATSMTGSTLGRGGDCLRGDTEVITLGGSKRIDELDLSAAPEYVLSYAQDKTPTYRRIVAIARRRAKEFWRIRTRSGNVVEATGEHRFFTSRGLVQSMALIVGDVLVRSVPKDVRATCGRNDKATAPPRDGTILQSGMLDYGEESARGQEPLVLPRVRQETPEQEPFWQSAVQRRMQAPSLRAPCSVARDRRRTQLRDLRHEIQTSDQYDPRSVLLAEVQEYWPFGRNERPIQSGLSAWERQSNPWRQPKEMADPQAPGVRAGSLDVYGLRQAECSPPSSPHQFKANRQSSGELGEPLPKLSPKASCCGTFQIEDDVVSLVERISEETIVYDIQVEETECFFANGVLVHNCRIVDDPQSVEDANSQVETENVTRTYRESLQTRETDPSTSAEVLIMQRLGQDDLSGYILQKARDDVVHVCYPMRHIPEAHCTTPWYDDPRTERDELLWPEQFPKSVVDNYEFELGPFSFAGQFMQQPVPRGGGIFKNEWFEAWPPLDEMGEPPIGAIVNGRIIYPALEYVVAWLDTAHTIKEENDFCAMLTFGVFRAEGKGRIERQADGQYIRVADDQGYPKVLLLNAWLKRLTIHGPPEELPPGVDLKTWNSPQYLLERQKNWGLVEWVHHTAKRYKVDHLGIETQAVGHQLEQELHRLHSDATWSVELVPARGDKVARAYAVQGIVSSRQVYLPTFPDGTYPSWVDPCLDQILMFPKGRHDDATDAFCAGLKHLRDIGIFERRGEYEIAEEQSRIWIPGQRRLELPYDL